MKNKLMFASALAMIFATSAAANAEELEFTRNGIEYETADENLQIVLGGRLHLDAASIDNDGVESEDEEIRRARLELAFRFFDDWRLRIDREFTDDGGWRNVWLSYDVNDDFTIKAGNYIAPFSMEDVGSSNDTMFMERSLAQALAPGFGVGLGFSYEGDSFAIAGGYFGDAIDGEDDIQAEKGQGFAVRGFWTPIEARGHTLHLGVGLERREFDDGSVRRISSRPEAALGPTVANTGDIAAVDSAFGYNLEIAYERGPVLIQGQFISQSIDRDVGGDLSFDGYYLQAGWIVTGERHRYSDSSGVFNSPIPSGNWGAVELTARISSLDLTDIGAGGEQVDDYTFGVNWYLNRNVRLLANFVHSEVDAVNPLLDREVDVIQARLQFDF